MTAVQAGGSGGGYPGVVRTGGYEWEGGSRYVGEWNAKGEKHGLGRLKLADGTRYHGTFQNGLCSGLGVMAFPDGAKYEGELMQGWFHGHGVFWRSDGMKYEGEFRGGRIWGLGMVTFSDGTHGFPRNEGYFQDCKLMRKKPCQDVVQRAQRVALMARTQELYDVHNLARWIRNCSEVLFTLFCLTYRRCKRRMSQ